MKNLCKPILTAAGLMTLALTSATVLADATAVGADMTVEMHKVSKNGIGEPIGEVRILEHADGVLFEPQLEGLEPGLHGFHLHQDPSCEAASKNGEMTAAASAGGHFDPDATGAHNGPFHQGHLGDLPALYVSADGTATHPVLAPRLEFQQVPGHALMIHSEGDNYADKPKSLGGGGPRVACAVVSPD